MGATTSKDETVTTKPQNADTVKKSDFMAYYNEGHSLQETADHFNVEVDGLIEVMGLQNVEEDKQVLASDDAAAE